MAITTSFNLNDLSNELEAQKQLIFEKVFLSFHRAGLNFVTSAREQIQDHALGTYLDDTTNLRNSIGYYIFQDGKLVEENTIGNAIANRQAIEDIIKSDGIQLIGIAGMNYASYVESKGYNVISYQADVCVIDLSVYLETMKLIPEGSAAKFEDSITP